MDHFYLRWALAGSGLILQLLFYARLLYAQRYGKRFGKFVRFGGFLGGLCMLAFAVMERDFLLLSAQGVMLFLFFLDSKGNSLNEHS